MTALPRACGLELRNRIRWRTWLSDSLPLAPPKPRCAGEIGAGFESRRRIIARVDGESGTLPLIPVLAGPRDTLTYCACEVHACCAWLTVALCGGVAEWAFWPGEGSGECGDETDPVWK